VDLSGKEYSESEYRKLVEELHGRTPRTPSLGPPPRDDATRGGRRTPEAARSELPAAGGPIRILGVDEEAVASPRGDGTCGSVLYAVPFHLSRRPSGRWAKLFVEGWNRLRRSYSYEGRIAAFGGRVRQRYEEARWKFRWSNHPQSTCCSVNAR
jgi:hypothetical protein